MAASFSREEIRGAAAALEGVRAVERRVGKGGGAMGQPRVADAHVEEQIVVCVPSGSTAVERRAILQFADQSLELHHGPDLAGGKNLRRNDDRLRGELDLDQHDFNLPIPAE